MSEPTKKAEEMEKLIDAFNPSGRKRVDSIKADICSWCGKPATEFSDELSRREYTISGFCQECQNRTFSPCPRMKGREYGKAKPEVEVHTLQRPAYGYCVMKCLRELCSEAYAHLPTFCTVEEHGIGNPVTLRHGSGKVICNMSWDEFKKVYVMD